MSFSVPKNWEVLSACLELLCLTAFCKWQESVFLLCMPELRLNHADVKVILSVYMQNSPKGGGKVGHPC